MLDKFLAFKATVEAEHKREGRPMPSPNDLDDKFFSFQQASPQAVARREGTERWAELYHKTPEYLQLAGLIEEACREYIRRFARPGTLEQVGKPGDFSSDMWAAVYIPGTVHSHHTHQMSIVSAVYYSKTGPRNTPIVFSDPRGAAPIQNFEQFEGEHDFEPAGPFHQQFSYFPEEGELILFPSWLVHKVPGHNAKEERVAWPYNYKGSTWDGWARTAL